MNGTKEYLRSMLPQMLLITAVFIISTAAGYAYTSISPESTVQSLEGFEELVEIIKDMPPIGIMLFIFFNNAIKSLIALMLGVGFGIVPLLFIISNGYIIGIIANIVAAEKGMFYVLAAIAPHGIIELPMVLLSAAIGLRIGYETFRAVSGQEADIKREFVKGVKFFFQWIMPLLFVAAVIETFVTPLVITSLS